MLTAAHCMCQDYLPCKRNGSKLQVPFDPKRAVHLFLGVNGKKVEYTQSFDKLHKYDVNHVIVHPKYKGY